MNQVTLQSMQVPGGVVSGVDVGERLFANMLRSDLLG